MRTRNTGGRILWTMVMTVVLGAACLDRPPPPEPTVADRSAASVAPAKAEDDGGAKPEDEPPEDAPPPEPRSTVEPSPPPAEPTVERGDGHSVIFSPAGVEDLILIPTGLAFTEGNTLWILEQDDAAPRRLITTPDPHGLACDGTWLYWLGHERNGRLELATETVKWLPPMAPPGQDRDLAFGDVLYGRSERAVWRFKGLGVTRISSDDDDFRSPIVEIGAGNRTVVLPMADRTVKGSISFFLLRLGMDGKRTKIPFVGLPRAWRWSVSRAGNVVFLGEPGQVLRQDAKASKPRVLLEEPGVAGVCWCGDDVCTVDGDDDVIRRHRRGAPEAEIVAEGIGGSVRNLACGPDRIAWSARKGEDRAREIHLVQAR